MEAILVTTTEGHENLERARDRFAQAAKEREDEEPQRKSHRLMALVALVELQVLMVAKELPRVVATQAL